MGQTFLPIGTLHNSHNLFWRSILTPISLVNKWKAIEVIVWTKSRFYEVSPDAKPGLSDSNILLHFCTADAPEFRDCGHWSNKASVGWDREESGILVVNWEGKKVRVSNTGRAERCRLCAWRGPEVPALVFGSWDAVAPRHILGGPCPGQNKHDPFTLSNAAYQQQHLALPYTFGGWAIDILLW